VLGLIDGHLLIDSMFRVWVLRIDFPSGSAFHQGQFVRPVAVNFVGGREDEYRLGTVESGRFQQDQW
jgi:hypothetical protein